MFDGRVKILLVLTFVVNALFAEAAENMRDPTQPLGRMKLTRHAAPLVLQAVFKGNHRNTVVINGKTLKEGDLVDGARIMKIEEKSVVYSRAGRTCSLALRPNLIKPVR